MSISLITTEDGSLSCRDSETGELYHNRAGAITEARASYLYPSAAVEVFRSRGRLNVLDICFGLGYNTWVLLAALAEAPNVAGCVNVLGIDLDSTILTCIETVLEDRQLSVLKGKFERNPSLGKTFGQISKSVHCNIEIRQADLRLEIPKLSGDFDLIFHDPFSPNRVPELWTIELFRHYHRLLERRRGKVLTYSAASAVRGGFRECGFEIFRTAAVGAKSGGTLAAVAGSSPPSDVVGPIFESELEKLDSRSGVPYRDFSGLDSRTDILKRREVEQKSKQILTTNKND